MPRKANPVKKFRRHLYKTARLIGDITSVVDGTMHKRIIRRLMGKVTSRGLGSMFRGLFK